MNPRRMKGSDSRSKKKKRCPFQQPASSISIIKTSIRSQNSSRSEEKSFQEESRGFPPIIKDNSQELLNVHDIWLFCLLSLKCKKERNSYGNKIAPN